MNWGIMGCATIAKNAIGPAILATGEDKLVAVASRDKKKAELFANEFTCELEDGYQALLDRTDINAVYIPLPTGLHFEWIIKSLEAGKHVLVEKSAVTCLVEAKKIIDLATKKNLLVVENFQFQHHSQNLLVKELLLKKEIGDLRAFKSSFGFPPFDVDSNIRYKKELGGGSLLDSGAYVLKAASFLFGNTIELVSSFLVTHDHFEVDWYGGVFLVDKQNGIPIHGTFGFDNFYQCSYEIWGSIGKITLTRAFTAKPDFKPTLILEKNGKTDEMVLPKDNHFINMIKYFNRTIDSSNFIIEHNNLLFQAYLISQARENNIL